jgi:hypothetical protein
MQIVRGGVLNHLFGNAHLDNIRRRRAQFRFFSTATISSTEDR